MEKDTELSWVSQMGVDTTVLTLRLAEAILALVDVASPISDEERRRYRANIAGTAQSLISSICQQEGSSDEQIWRERLPRVYAEDFTRRTTQSEE